MNRRRNPNVPPIVDPAASPYLEEGRALFNGGEHWHAHEAWEHLWLGLEGDEKLFVQGLIMGAAMLVQYGKGVQAGVESHWKNVNQRLAGKSFWGIDGDHVISQLAPFVETPNLDPSVVQVSRDSQN